VILPEWHLLRPAWLLALLPLAIGLWRLARRDAGASAWRGVVDAELLPHLLAGGNGRFSRLPLLLLALGGLIGILALAGPVWERLPQPAYRTQAERVIVLDLSPTMNATDLAPSRLAHARFKILDLLKRFREGQTGLIAYGAEPFVVSPLTADANTIAAQVPSLTTDLLPVEGPKRTGLALEAAGRLLSQAGSSHGRVILLTDALDNPAAALEAARALRGQGYRLSVLGLGTSAGATVPVPGGGFLKDSQGAIRMPKLAVATLRSLAGTGGGRYLTATLDDRDIEALAGNEPSQWRQKGADESTLADRWREEGPWLLLALLPLAAIAFRRGWLAPLVLLVFLVPAPPAEAFSWSDLWLRPDQQASRLLGQGASQDAARLFRRPDWRAAAAYAAGDYRNALDALDGLNDPNAWYNRGNTLARLGDYEQAIAQYDKVLARRPDDADTRHNRDLVRQLLEQQRQARQGQPGNRQDGGDRNGPEQATERGQAQSGQSDNGEQQDGRQSGQSGQGEKQDQGRSSQQGQAQPGRQAPSGHPGEAQSAADRTDQPGAASTAAATPPPAREEQDRASADEADTRAPQARTDAGTPAASDANDSGAERLPETAQDTPRAEPAGTPGAPAASDRDTARTGAEPGRADLLGGRDIRGQARAAGSAAREPLTEAQQALENQLNRVPDDPAGLLRQRFLLQHLRRSGQL